MDTLERICEIVGSRFDISTVKLTEDTAWDEIGADSIDLVDLISEVEAELNVSVPDDAIEDFKCIGDLVRFIEENG